MESQIAQFLLKVNDWLEIAGLVALLVLVVATGGVWLFGFIAKFTVSTKDDEQAAVWKERVHNIAIFVLNALAYFPTAGKNPRTKMLEQQLKKMDPTLVVVQTNIALTEVKAAGDEKPPQAN